jgi:hypothetical protein
MTRELGGRPVRRRAKDLEMDTLPEESPGELAAAIFEDFDKGKDLRHIVKTRSVTPEQVLALYEQWSEPDLAKRHTENEARRAKRRVKHADHEDAKQQVRSQAALDREITSAQIKNAAMRERLTENEASPPVIQETSSMGRRIETATLTDRDDEDFGAKEEHER